MMTVDRHAKRRPELPGTIAEAADDRQRRAGSVKDLDVALKRICNVHSAVVVPHKALNPAEITVATALSPETTEKEPSAVKYLDSIVVLVSDKDFTVGADPNGGGEVELSRTGPRTAERADQLAVGTVDLDQIGPTVGDKDESES